MSTCRQQVEWRDDPDALRRWQEGTTGLPLVDANMREMAQTGTAPMSPDLSKRCPWTLQAFLIPCHLWWAEALTVKE